MAIDVLGRLDPDRFMVAAGGVAAAGAARTSANGLSAEADQEVRKLRQTDRKVRAHEQAHLGAAAGLAVGGVSLQTVRGPDGRQYAVGGEVSIDVSPARTPQQTIDKARRIQAAALAPADPSAQDRAVAAAAAQMQAEAQAEIARQQRADSKPDAGQDAAADRGRQARLAAYVANEPAPAPQLSLFA